MEDLEDVCSYMSVGFIFCFLIVFNSTIGSAIWIYNAEIMNEKGNSLATGL